jgi:phage repressor protein C with HTH and peptisase S24 domain
MNTATTSFQFEKLAARLGACRTVELASDAFRPAFHKGDLLVVDEAARPMSDDTVAIEFRNGKQFVALYAGKRNGQLMLRTFGHSGDAFAIDEMAATSLGRVVATFRP